MGDYKDKTVTPEEFPHLDRVRMVSIHPCRHASVMRTLLDRADAALKLRRQRQLAAMQQKAAKGSALGAEAAAATDALENPVQDEWEEIVAEDSNGTGGASGEEDVAIRVDQYLVVFLKFMASVTPGIEHDFTMGV